MMRFHVGLWFFVFDCAYLERRVWEVVKTALDEVSNSRTLLRVLGCGHKVFGIENEVVFSLGNRLISPHVVEEFQMMPWWRLTKGTDLRVVQKKFNYNFISLSHHLIWQDKSD
jgi:hypothetical protein